MKTKAKTCTGCHLEKLLSEYALKTDGKDGRKARCKECLREEHSGGRPPQGTDFTLMQYNTRLYEKAKNGERPRCAKCNQPLRYSNELGYCERHWREKIA